MDMTGEFCGGGSVHMAELVSYIHIEDGEGGEGTLHIGFL